MRVLIATPIHFSQDHAQERWLQNVSRLEYPADLFLVDNSPNTDYLETVKGYCAKHGICNYKITHLDFNQGMNADEKDLRIEKSQEIIRQEILAQGYDAWFSWEVDQTIPINTLNILVTLMKARNYALVSHNPLSKEISRENETPFGCDLIHKNTLKRYGFLVGYPDMPNCWYDHDVWFKKRLNRDGGRQVEININNFNHLKWFKKTESLKLNLGCGRQHQPGYINIDIQEPCDVQLDLRDLLPFEDNSVDEILSEDNVICLFSRQEWKNLKKEMVRVLKPGGKLDLIFVNLISVFRAFLNNQGGRRWSWWRQTIFAGQYHRYDFAKNGFTYDKLVFDLRQEGMTNFSQKPLRRYGYFRLTAFKRDQK